MGKQKKPLLGLNGLSSARLELKLIINEVERYLVYLGEGKILKDQE